MPEGYSKEGRKLGAPRKRPEERKETPVASYRLEKADMEQHRRNAAAAGKKLALHTADLIRASLGNFDPGIDLAERLLKRIERHGPINAVRFLCRMVGRSEDETEILIKKLERHNRT